MDFFWDFTATKLERQVQQERTKVVCSSRVARRRPARRHSHNSCYMFACIVAYACSRHALDLKMLFFGCFVITKGLLRDYFT